MMPSATVIGVVRHVHAPRTTHQPLAFSLEVVDHYRSRDGGHHEWRYVFGVTVWKWKVIASLGDLHDGDVVLVEGRLQGTPIAPRDEPKEGHIYGTRRIIIRAHNVLRLATLPAFDEDDDPERGEEKGPEGQEDETLCGS